MTSSIAPVFEHETPAQDGDTCTDPRHGGRAASRIPLACARWKGEPKCGQHLNGKRRQHHGDVERERKRTERDARHRAAMAAAARLTALGVNAEGNYLGLVLLSSEVANDLAERLKG